MNTTTPTSATVIGADVGGTKIAAGLVTTEGHIRRHRSRPTPKDETPDAILDSITQLIAELREQDDEPVIGVGVGTGGVVDHGVVVSANDLLPGWAGTPLGPSLAERTGLPVRVDNDANTHALGEIRFGTARDTPDLLFAAVGTGIGGALIIDGRIRRGAHNLAGALGHQPVPQQSDHHCHHTKNLESVAAGPAILEDYRSRGGAAETDLGAVAERATAGDSLAADAIARGARTLGRVLAGVTAMIDPHAVIVGGGVAQIGAHYWDPLRAAFFDEPHTAEVEIRPARLGSQASIIGAATLAFDHTPAREEPR